MIVVSFFKLIHSILNDAAALSGIGRKEILKQDQTNRYTKKEKQRQSDHYTKTKDEATSRQKRGSSKKPTSEKRRNGLDFFSFGVTNKRCMFRLHFGLVYDAKVLTDPLLRLR